MDFLKIFHMVLEGDRHYSRQGATYRHHWLPGDLVAADNLHVAHKATLIRQQSRRILNRTVRADGVIRQDSPPAASPAPGAVHAA